MNQHVAMQALAKAKLQVAQQVAVLSKDTVLYEMTGQTPGNSYFTIQEGVANKNNIYAGKYKQFVVDYAQEWYRTVTNRVGEGLKKAETMRVELDHYQSKVESLRQSANSTMAKGKQVDTKAAEKLTRNEDKLIKIKETCSRFVNDLCLLMEEVTERSWRDLHPLLVKCAQFETQVSGDESKAQVALNEVVSALKKVAEEHGIKPEARLKDLEQLDAHKLTTRSKDDSRNHLAIENGLSGLALSGSYTGDGSVYGSGSVYSSDNNSSYFPPGSTAPQGLGGFPVRMQPDSFGSGQPSNSGSNGNGAPSTMNMMNIHAAPAPTLDTMAQAFGGGAAAAPSYGRSGSMDSNYSGSNNFGTSATNNFSGVPAPPPSSAPPPPPPTPGSGAPSPGPYGVPAASPMPSFGYPQQQQQPMPATSYGHHPQQQQQSHMPGNFAQQQSPMPGAAYGGGGFAQQQQQSPMGGGFSQQQSPMGGSFSQQPPQSMFTSPPPKRASAPPAYNQQNPFG